MPKRKTTDEPETPENPYSARYWADEIARAEERYKPFVEMARESIKVFKAGFNLPLCDRKLNCWWETVTTLLPAYCSSTPKAEAELRNKAGTTLHQQGAILQQRTIQYQIDEEFDFEETCVESAQGLMLTGRAVLWPRYEAEVQVEGEAKKKTGERAILDLLNYNDFLTSDGRSWAEREWEARRAYLSRDEAEALFGEEFADSLEYNSFPEEVKNRERTAANTRDKVEGKAEMWEIWHEATGKVYHLQTSGDKRVFAWPPPIDYEGFYCSVVLDSTTDPDCLIPTSDYALSKDQILEIERFTTRIAWVTDAIKVSGGYNKILGKEVEQILKGGDNKFVPLDPPGDASTDISNAIYTLPLDVYAQVLQTLMEQREISLQKLRDKLGASEVMRGTTDPRKTATAARLENQWSSLRLIVKQNRFAKFISEGVSRIGVIISQQFDPERILELGQGMTLFNGDQQAAMAAIGIIKNKAERCYNIKISTDSLVAVDARQERADTAETISAVVSMFKEMGGVIETYPPLLGWAMALTERFTRSLRYGKEVEGINQQALAQLGPMIQQKTQQAQQTPPDPATVQAQSRLQVAQIQAQSAEKKSMVEMQLQGMKAQIEQARFALDSQIATQEMQIKIITALQTMDATKAQGLLEVEQHKLDALIATQDAQIKQQELQLKTIETLLEEKRLAREHEFDRENADRDHDRADRQLDHSREYDFESLRSTERQAKEKNNARRHADA